MYIFPDISLDIKGFSELVAEGQIRSISNCKLSFTPPSEDRMVGSTFAGVHGPPHAKMPIYIAFARFSET